ncbi:hypothetical protein E1B28_001897 [Marasmius oreades]|uniref:Uncharacterized protein n=1 Tax=Marasmius oreades TaxID=181124 RepID=A0A9P7V4Q0_9AGAR|nr:uncharacterized protein E1B28_001897 [Marasmius oreades]KAG7100117.1 hypothetical protein E1B28_001897 [Marasmius oreades]
MSNLGLGYIHQDSVSTARFSQEHSSPSDDTAAPKHGTRPPISPLGSCKVPINEAGISPRSDYDVEDGNNSARPPPAPSISCAKPPFTLSLPSNKQRRRRGCLKQPSPLSSPSFSSPDASPALNYATFYHTLGGPGCSPPIGSDGSRSKGSSGSSTPKKTVSWCSQEQTGLGYLENVYPVDDWDRTPMEPVRTPLSYKDILELKAIQRTLPHAQQLPDPFTGKPANQYLSNVPIGLLPLLPDTAPHTPSSTPNISPSSSTGVTPNGSGSTTPLNISPRGSQHGTPEQSAQPSPRESPRGSPLPSPVRSPDRSPERGSSSSPPIHAHSPKISSPLAPPHPPSGAMNAEGNTNMLAPPTPRPRTKPTFHFNFVPLLDTPATSPTSVKPTSPSNALDSIPQALNAALGNLCNRNTLNQNDDEDSPPPTPALTITSLGCDSCSEVDTELSDIGEDMPFGVMFRKDADGSYDSYSRWRGRPLEKEDSKNKKKTKKNVIYINGEEIDLDGNASEEDEEDEQSCASSTCAVEHHEACSTSVIYINGEACTLDETMDIPSEPKTSSSRNLSPPSRRSRTPSPEPERKPRSHVPISPFHRAHPNFARMPSPEKSSRSYSPISPFHRAHPNLQLRSFSRSPTRD